MPRATKLIRTLSPNKGRLFIGRDYFRHLSIDDVNHLNVNQGMKWSSFCTRYDFVPKLSNNWYDTLPTASKNAGNQAAIWGNGCGDGTCPGAVETALRQMTGGHHLRIPTEANPFFKIITV